MAIPTADEFKAAVEKAFREQSAWAAAEFDLDFHTFPIRIQMVTTARKFLGEASVVKDKQERLSGYKIRIVNFNFLRYMQIAVSEYASFNKSKVVGGFISSDWRLGVDTLMAHEMAHVVQFALKYAAYDAKAAQREHSMVAGWNGSRPVFKDGLGPYEGEHGKFFQGVYARFRKKWINHRVDPVFMTAPSGNFLIPDDFEERLARMPKSGLEGIKFMSNGRQLTVVGRNPDTRRRLYNYTVQDSSGKFLMIKMAAIAARSPEAMAIINSVDKLNAEFYVHCLAVQNKKKANAKSSRTKQKVAA